MPHQINFQNEVRNPIKISETLFLFVYFLLILIYEYDKN